MNVKNDSESFSKLPVCTLKQQKRIGDGICDDDVNVKECQFDGGDCCNPDADIFFCDDCICIQPFNETGEPLPKAYRTQSNTHFQLWNG